MPIKNMRSASPCSKWRCLSATIPAKEHSTHKATGPQDCMRPSSSSSSRQSLKLTFRSFKRIYRSRRLRRGKWRCGVSTEGARLPQAMRKTPKLPYQRFPLWTRQSSDSQA